MNTTKTQVRLPEVIHEWIVQAAKQNSRSMNGEIVYMLNNAIEKERQEAKMK